MKTHTKTTVETVAAELAAAFCSDKRPDGDTFYMLKKDCASWITSGLMRKFHEAVDDRLPNDWTYEAIAIFADNLTQYEDCDAMRDASGELADGQVDIYNHDRARWLASHLGNHALCDEAVSEGLCDGKDIDQTIGCGQYLALERILQATISAIEDEAEDRDSKAEDTDESD